VRSAASIHLEPNHRTEYHDIYRASLRPEFSEASIALTTVESYSVGFGLSQLSVRHHESLAAVSRRKTRSRAIRSRSAAVSAPTKGSV